VYCTCISLTKSYITLQRNIGGLPDRVCEIVSVRKDLVFAPQTVTWGPVDKDLLLNMILNQRASRYHH
jgi:hypothetical protein